MALLLMVAVVMFILSALAVVSANNVRDLYNGKRTVVMIVLWVSMLSWLLVALGSAVVVFSGAA